MVNLGIVIIYTMCNCDSEYKLDKITFVDKKIRIGLHLDI